MRTPRQKSKGYIIISRGSFPNLGKSISLIMINHLMNELINVNAKKRTDLSNHILIWKHNESEAQKSEEENPQETEKQVKGILFKQFVC
jgi:hypothetical protein